ncbi:hypothetical protein [Deinococcus aluminii]|uniref:Uncharacterized protein n=1 Tax=Deinococcus aluminii TaxID=1656885 RepID=A0ABP9X9G9_9DEIO
MRRHALSQRAGGGFLLLLLAALPFLAWPLLWLKTSDSAMLQRQEKDADALFRAAPLATLTGMVKVSGPVDRLEGRYLARSIWAGNPLGARLRAAGWTWVDQFGAVTVYRRAGAHLTTSCRRFSAGFDVCQVQTELASG